MLEITVKTLDSQNHSFTAEDDITVRGFKEHIAETVSVPAESQRLIYCGRVLQDDKKLNDYDVNGKVIHLVQRAPPQPESRSSNNDGQRQNNNGNWPHGGPRLQYRGHVHRNAMYVSAMPVSAELVEGHGLPAPQLSNTLSNSRLVGARRMLDKAIQLMDRLDDPSVPLHPSPTENNSSESQPPPSVPEEETEQDSSVNSNLNNARDRMVQAASEIANAFSAATLINIRLSHDNDDIESVSGTVNVMNGSSSEQSNQSQNQSEARSPSQAQSQVQPEAQAQPQAQPQVQPQAQSQDQAEAETQESEPQRSQTEEPAQQRSEREAPDSERGPRPPQMAELLDKLMSTQDRLRPHVEFYRNLMSNDPVLNRANGPGSVAESQRIVDGVSESLHYLAHACHALSDIIVDMGQQPPRNLRCRPLIIQHSAILQTGIPIQVESHINLSRNNTNSNNTTDEGNEATRPSSPSATSDQNNRSNNTNGRPASQSTNNQQNPASLLGTLLNLPNVELSMELSPQSAMDSSSPNTIVVDGSEIDQGQSNNNNGNAGEPGNMYSMPPPLPFAFIRDALQSVLSERHSQMEPSGTSINIGTPTNIPFVTIVGQQMDINTPNSGQSTQARSNIGTHPTTSTQTRSTARPHVLHPHTHPLNVGMGMGQSLSFDPFLPCNSHHVRRNTPASTSSTSTSQSNQANQSTTSESHSRTQSSSNSSSTSQPQSHTVNFTLAGDRNVTRDLENEGQALASGIRLAMSLGELFQGSDNDDVHISLVGSGPNANEIHLTPNSNVSLAEFLRLLNVRLVEFTTRNFLIDFWLFLLRNMTFEGLMQLSVGQLTPLISLRQPLREFLEHSFPNASRTTLQEQVAEQITSLTRPYLQTIVVPQQETASRPVDVSATIESLLRKFYLEFLRCLFNNDLDDTTFAQEAVALTKKLEEQSSAVLQYILQGGETTVQNIVSRFISQHLRGICHPFVLRALLGVLSTGVRSFATQTTSMSQSEITSLLVYKDETSSSSSQPIPSAPMPEDIEPEPIIKEAQRDVEMALQEEMQAQAPIPIQTSSQLPHQSTKPEVQGNSKQDISESMDLEIQKDLLEEDDPMDLAHGEEIPETFPGAENLPPEWVPIIARDAVRQRRQTQLNALQGGPIPFSDAYLSCMPSKRRKLIEQQKPQLLVNNPPPNTTAIAASVERLVREGISHTPQVSEVEGAANAVASSPGVRNAFGQAIKDCIHPSRFKTPDFPNAHRFPNASKYFANDDGSSKNKEKKDTSSTTTTPPASTTNMEK